MPPSLCIRRGGRQRLAPFHSISFACKFMAFLFTKTKTKNFNGVDRMCLMYVESTQWYLCLLFTAYSL